MRGYTPPRPFGLYDDGLAAHEILRLLLGSVNIRDADADDTILLVTNELGRGGSRVASPATIAKLVLGEDISVAEYGGAIRSISNNNGEFFRRLQQELVLALVRKRQGRPVESFLYMYRILELISVAVPILYVLTQRNFVTSQSFLKALFTADRDGELKALKSALPHIARSGGFSDLTFDFNVSGIDRRSVEELRDQFDTRVRQAVNGFEFEEDEGDVLFRVPFISMSSLFVVVRNKIFHFKAAEANIELGQIGGADLICQVCVDPIVQWFALLYTEILRILARREL